MGIPISHVDKRGRRKSKCYAFPTIFRILSIRLNSVGWIPSIQQSIQFKTQGSSFKMWDQQTQPDICTLLVSRHWWKRVGNGNFPCGFPTQSCHFPGMWESGACSMYVVCFTGRLRTLCMCLLKHVGGFVGQDHQALVICIPSFRYKNVPTQIQHQM